jgi:acetylornithine deacetylase/succinyl-diaminopimelate desuccinylase-like protein
VSFRLVPGQDPDAVVEGFRRFVAERAAPGAQAEVRLLTAAPAIEVAEESPYVRAATAALEEEFGRPALMIGSGGSIPVVASLKRALGIDSLLVGFGLDDDQVHSPNEKFEQTCFHRGIRSHARLLAKLAAMAAPQ